MKVVMGINKSSRRGLISCYIPILCLIMLFISTVVASRDLVSDGSNNVSSSYIRLPSTKSLLLSESCEQTYGFMPCTTSALGNFMLIVAYGYLIFSGALHLSDGSELLLEIVGPGIVAGLFLPLLGALPDATLILVSGLSGSNATAQTKVSAGMGMLAGSTIMLLTVIWGSIVLVGKCDLVNSRAFDVTDTKGFHLQESGVSTDIWTSYGARIMTLSAIPFLVVQSSQALHYSSGKHFAVLISLILSLVMLFGYCAYQVSIPTIQVRRLDFVTHKRVMTGFFTHVRKNTGKLTTSDGSLNRDGIEKFFKQVDKEGVGYISKVELRALVIGMRSDWMGEGESKVDFIVQTIMDEFDKERPDGRIDLDEFIKGITRFYSLLRGDKVSCAENTDTLKELGKVDTESKMEHCLLGGDDRREIGQEIENVKATTIKAIFCITLGTIITVAFADPLIDAVNSFSIATNIPPFFISFIALPLITNSKGAVSVISFASKKKRKSASLAFSELYGEVTMGNLVGLSVFLALVYTRDLTWDFSAQVLIVLLVCLVMGTLTSFRTSFPLWTSVMAFLLCPLSLMFVYVFGNFFGRS